MIARQITAYYQNRIIINDGEKSNGYKLPKIQSPIMERPLFLDLVELWQSDGQSQMTFNEFYDKCCVDMCTDWNKQDQHGECFGGYWEYPEGTFERENAFSLSKRKSILELYKLPWPIAVLFRTIEIGCRNRNESVAYSNFICEWLFRKYNQLHPNGPELALRTPLFPDGFDEQEYLYGKNRHLRALHRFQSLAPF